MAQHSDIAKSAMTPSPCSSANSSPHEPQPNGASTNGHSNAHSGKDPGLTPHKTVVGRALGNDLHPDAHRRLSKDGVGFALSDTPISTAPPSPQMYVPRLLFLFPGPCSASSFLPASPDLSLLFPCIWSSRLSWPKVLLLDRLCLAISFSGYSCSPW